MDRICTMTDRIFKGAGHFGKGFFKTVRHEDGIVSEPAFTALIHHDLSLDDAFKKVFLSVFDQRDHRAKARRAVI